MNNNMYAYVMVTAVLLAGVAGYMMSDSSDSVTIELTDDGSYNLVVDVINGVSEVTEITEGEFVSNGS